MIYLIQYTVCVDIFIFKHKKPNTGQTFSPVDDNDADQGD